MNNIICSLVISGNELDHSHISESLEAVPTRAYGRGEAYIGKAGNTYMRTSGLWALDSSSTVFTNEFSDHFQFIVEFAREKRDRILELKEAGTRVSIRVSCELGDDIFSETIRFEEIDEIRGVLDGIDLVIT